VFLPICSVFMQRYANLMSTFGLLFALTIGEFLLYSLDKIDVMLASEFLKGYLSNRKEKKEE
jgi:hypothetical protein